MRFDINTIVMILLIAGSINWGLVAYDNKMDLVAFVSATPDIEKYIKYAVGFAGAYALYQFAKHNL